MAPRAYDLRPGCLIGPKSDSPRTSFSLLWLTSTIPVTSPTLASPTHLLTADFSQNADLSQTNLPQNVRWIRFERHSRFHAVYAENDGQYRTFCFALASKDVISHLSNDPPSRCRCCTSRLKHPYLIPGARPIARAAASTGI